MYQKIKILTIVFMVFVASVLHAQKNVFLERSYWKSAPDVTAIQAEIQKGSDPTQLNSDGFDATVYSILEQAPDASIKYLLSLDGNGVNKITHDGRTYIFWAAYKGNVSLMEDLLSKGAKTNLLDDHGNTILNFAASTGQKNTKVYDFCLREGANLTKDLNHDGANALLLIVPYDTDFALLDYFINKGLSLKSVDANGNTAFNYAAKTGNVTTLKALLGKGVTYTDNAMLMAAGGTRSTTNTIKLYQYLESLKISPSATGKNGENALHSIVRKEKQANIIKYFISKGADVNQADHEGNTPFMNAAAANAEPEVFELLIANIKNTNRANKKGVTPLAMAVRSNTPEIVQWLLAKGADIKSTDTNGDNLAYYLLQSYNPQKTAVFESKLKILEAAGLHITAPQKNGNTLYHLAVSKNDLALLKRLEVFNIDINAKNKEGMTALHKAAMTAHDDAIIRYLLAKGAKKETETEFKETAFDLASENESLTKNKISIDFLK